MLFRLPPPFRVLPPASFGIDLPPGSEERAASLLGRLANHFPQGAAHALRVAQLVMAMWETDPEWVGPADAALLGSLLHDVGKLYVPRSILESDQPLDGAERVLMMEHPALGAELLAAQGFGEDVIAVARDHHERWSGPGGYPSGRPAASMPPVVRVVAVADSFVAMTEPGRGYRPPLSHAAALREVAACAGTHFDPRAADLLARSLVAWREMAFEPTAELAGEPVFWPYGRGFAATAPVSGF
ncbi:HD-GYP domain-containing protein [Roseococcus sp. YIM B11640]|uniref:HD-GYP domain-containing protein n=1 Tax=Roseococcus sp. YIM B11640 TaxID=3133973 RepID=UPI003C7D72D1